MTESDPNSNSYLLHLDNICAEDAAALKVAQTHYGNSWKQRGGVGAFMMAARKWDRLEKQLRREFPLVPGEIEVCELPAVGKYDVLQHLERDTRTEGLIDDIRDLRRYLMLFEAEARAMELPCAQPMTRDSTTE